MARLQKSSHTSRGSGVARTEFSLTNSEISELLAAEGDHATQPLRRALRRASRKAFLWPEEAAHLYQEGRSLQELAGIGPYLERMLRRWIERPPAIPDPPELRQNFLTWTAAQSILQKDTSWRLALKGDLQMHSVWSDGSGSIQEMADTGNAMGYEYIAITDHSKGLKIADGINEELLQQQSLEIAEVNHVLASNGQKLRVLRSVELNLTPTGAGDMSHESLRQLDLVLGCFHSSLRKMDEQTERYLAALRNSDIQILGHPRGRIYNFRIGLKADWARVFATAAELDKAVEIDAYPDRQDLSLDLIRLAKKAGCRISIGTDSHGPSQLRFIQYGLAAARKAGIDRSRILNFMTRDELLAWANRVRENASLRAA